MPLQSRESHQAPYILGEIDLGRAQRPKIITRGGRPKQICLGGGGGGGRGGLRTFNFSCL
jgi:hypothetical protein